MKNFHELRENLRKDIAKNSSRFPEGSKVRCKKSGKTGKVLTVGKDFVKVAVDGGKDVDYKPSDLTPLGEAKSGEIKIVADTNTRKYKEGEVIKTFPETKAGLNQAMVFQISVKNKFGVDTKMVRESLDEETDVEEMSALTKIKAKLARAARGPSKKATPAMFRQTGKSARKVQQGAAKSKAYELGRKARESK